MHKYVKKFLLNCSYINDYYNHLVDKTKKLQYVGITNEWIIDNYYLIVEYKKNVYENKKGISKKLSKCDDIYAVIKDIVESNEYNLNYKLLIKDINIYQKKENTYFSYKEISSISEILLFIYISKLYEICKESHKELIAKEEIENILSNISDNTNIDVFTNNKIDIVNDSNYIFEINNQLKKIGVKTNILFKEYNLLLEKNNISLRDILSDEYQKRADSNLLIANIFNNIKEIVEYDLEDLFKSISKCEKYLIEDKVYYNMTPETKFLYRERVVKLARKNKTNEIDYIENLLKSFDISEEHIGYKLFNDKLYNNRVVIYIVSILILSFIVTWFLSKYFIESSILGFLILIIPISQLIIQIVNQIASYFVKIKPLPKMDYSKKIPEESTSMIVIPTIISDTLKVEKMFERLETFYIINKSENLYFTLLGDIKASDKKFLPIDNEIMKYGVSCAEKLNKKYKKDIFHFVYRKRVWNECENTYLGYERKRGALLQFNRLLLGKLTKKEEDKYFNVHTFKNFDKKIKYVIPVDTDTELVLNSLLNLIGCMAHPLNKPVLNKEKTKVISGYGIMQPRMNIDIESTNTSLYSQVFAGIGGFDTYSVLVPNIYSDLFHEGSFAGKGIYDLEVFDEVLYNRFPDNLILSHDLLEGNYLRCGYVSDVEFIEDFPSKFLVDTSRQHRWARGDTQIIGYLLKYVKNKNENKELNQVNILGKWKIFDNIARLFLYPSLLLLVICTLFFTQYKIWYLVLLYLVISFPIISFLKNKFYVKNDDRTTIYYSNLTFGGKSLLIRSLIVFSTIPYYSYLYMDAFFKSIYRMFVSHKNLLNWITAEEMEKKSVFSLFKYISNFKFNIFIGLCLLTLGIIYNNYYAITVGVIFLLAPLYIYYVSMDLNYTPSRLDSIKHKNIIDIARRTWIYFKDNLTEENNYLVSDNYQENRDIKMDYRTSSTDISYSLTSVICAYELKFIDIDEAVFYLDKIINTIDSLEKWNGHLYNWYDIKTKAVLNPKFVSTIDSGNLIASLIVVREFLMKYEQEKLVKLCDKLIKETNFKKLYTKKDVFSIGYSEEDHALSIYNYNKFASESRLTSFVAICKGDVSSKHWFCLDKSLTTYKKRKGLISWSGTAFEYFMPFLYMKNYKNTLLDESYNFAYFCQKNYIESVSKRLPWGISESAYNELDDSQNYKYSSFSVPILKAKEDKNNRIVISPYSSLMVMSLYPEDVYENILKFRQLNMLSKYGFYESYDYDTRNVVRSCFAHHQGMSLIGLTNYLKNDVIKEYFHSNVKVRTFDILLKEKVQVKADIDMKIAKYKKYNYKKEVIHNDIRAYSYISDMPEVSALSNKKYTLLMNDRGNSFSRYRTLQLNRYRKITEQDYGMFLYIKDIATNKVWSNTYAPINQKPDKYEVVFASDKIKYLRTDGYITTKTEVIVTRDYHAEIRKYTFTNDSDDFKVLELTTYTEPILCDNTADVAHKVFNNMFLESTYDDKTNSLIMMRKNREIGTKTYMVNRLLIENPVDKYTYETDRFNFIGRGHTATNPIAIDSYLSNTIGTSLEPVMSIRNKIEIAPNSSKTVYFICGFGRSMEQIKDIVNTYDNALSIKKAFQISNTMNIVQTKNMNLTGEEMRIFNIMLNYLYQTTKIAVNNERREYLRCNALAQNGLWRFGISGDRPIILVNIGDVLDLSFAYEILKAFEYFKNKSIFVDIIIVNSEQGEAKEIVKREINNELYRIYSINSFRNTPGVVTIVDNSKINEKEKSLLRIVPRLMFNVVDHHSLKDEIELLQKNNKVNDYKLLEIEENITKKYTNRLKFNNDFGGFSSNGHEYIITNMNTPTPWSNVISNGNFGTIITNNGCGYTYAYNSLEYKITSWTNEMIINDKSEGIKVDGKLFEPTKCTHGFGYSILESETKTLKHSLTEFIAKDDNVKIYILKLTNKEKEKKNLNISFFINPTFGNYEEKTSRHILTEFMGDDNYLKLRNVYSIDYSDVNVFMSSSEKIDTATIDRILVKDININISLDSKEDKEIVFTLGCSKSEDKNLLLINKYNNLDTAKKELKLVKDSWTDKLSTIQVNTPDDSFNYMINGWYLYQTISSRMDAKAGFYQVSGAFGYRDQLQDAMNICMVNPLYTRNQILTNAKHQFIEGDVLHWWHEKNRFGLRSRYKDDYLWLVYATIYYLEITGDSSILEEEVEFVVADVLADHENERGVIFTYSSYKKTLFEHLLLSLKLSMSSLGSHGLPLMGGGDWNDGMNKVGIKGKGESVWLGFFLYDIITNFIKILDKYYPDIKKDSYEKFNKKLKDNLNKNAWDKDYYLRAFFDNGDKLGSSENDECKIDLISQSFSILSDVIEKSRISSVINSVEERLVNKESKIIKLLDPPFEKSLNNPGYIMSYPKGIRENGGQYTHATAWYIMALIKCGYVDRAYKYYQMINPINRSLDKESVNKYKVEPYVIAADIYSKQGYEGRGGWTWYTGSAGWFYRVGIEQIIGLKRRGDRLYIEPNVPKEWKKYEIVYKYQDTIYNIKVIFGDQNKIIIDGKQNRSPNIIKLDNKKSSYTIEVYRKRGKVND